MCDINISENEIFRRQQMYFELYLTAIKGEVSKKRKKVWEHYIARINMWMQFKKATKHSKTSTGKAAAAFPPTRPQWFA